MRVWLRRLVRLAFLAVGAGLLLTGGGLLWIKSAAAGHVHAIADVPDAPVALVLGAQVHYPEGVPSPFLAARLEIARQLLADGKVQAILLSGDHGDWSYDEPGAMSKWLTERGVPARKIVQDHAGFDTYDSCRRANRIFGVREAIVVTQSFHIDRAVALCRDAGIETSGVADETVKIYTRPWYASAVREPGAAVKAMYDVLTDRDPVYLGDPEPGVTDALRS